MEVLTPKTTLLRVPAFDRMVEASMGRWSWRECAVAAAVASLKKPEKVVTDAPHVPSRVS